MTKPPGQDQDRTEARQYAEDAAPAHDRAELAAKYGAPGGVGGVHAKPARPAAPRRVSRLELSASWPVRVGWPHQRDREASCRPIRSS